MKTIITFLCALVSAVGFSQSSCQVDIVIAVKDASLGNPVAHARVLLMDGDKTIKEATTDDNGSVTLSADCGHNYTVEVYSSEFEPRHLDVATGKDSPVNVVVDLIPMAEIKSSGGYIDQFIVRVYNPGKNPVNIQFGPAEKAMKTYPISAGEMWESEPYESVSSLLLWITTGKVVKKYTTLPGKAYQIEFSKAKKCYVIKEVDVHK